MLTLLQVVYFVYSSTYVYVLNFGLFCDEKSNYNSVSFDIEPEALIQDP